MDDPAERWLLARRPAPKRRVRLFNWTRAHSLSSMAGNATALVQRHRLLEREHALAAEAGKTVLQAVGAPQDVEDPEAEAFGHAGTESA